MQPHHQGADKGIAAEVTPWFEAANDDVPKHEIGVGSGCPGREPGGAPWRRPMALT